MIDYKLISSLGTQPIKVNEQLRSFTTFKIGGPAKAVVFPSSEEELLKLIMYLEKCNIKYFVIGNGSNILVSDSGYDGIAICMRKGFREIRFANESIVAEAGVRLSRFVKYCNANSIAGFEMLAGIPGTIGGAVVINAGAHDSEISDNIVEVRIVRNGKVVCMNRASCNFAYRDSGLGNDIVLSATFSVRRENKECLESKRLEAIKKRKMSQPILERNAGSIFKNPKGYFAARLIDECGLKGYRVGGAEVSELHANFIVCHNDATANDVIAVISHLQSAVEEKYGICLELEIKLIGFDEVTMRKLGALQ